MTALVIALNGISPRRLPFFKQITADNAEADLVVALGLGIELRETLVGAVLGKYPVERSDFATVATASVPPDRHASNAGSKIFSARCTAAS